MGIMWQAVLTPVGIRWKTVFSSVGMTRKNVISPEGRMWKAVFPTCGNNVEDAGPGSPLLAHHVVRPAKDCPELHVGARRVGEPGPTGSGAEGVARQQRGGEGVVEGPGEGVRQRV
jgi:hypothetical protein